MCYFTLKVNIENMESIQVSSLGLNYRNRLIYKKLSEGVLYHSKIILDIEVDK
jgi:hypothetical protein